MSGIKKVILASSSPRRREILGMLGIPFEIILPMTEENSDETRAGELVKELSAQKYGAVYDKCVSDGLDTEHTLIIACDTVVECGGDILGKPRDNADAERMLLELSGKVHSVYSGLTLGVGTARYSEYARTSVTFASFGEETAREYVKTGEPAGKAGAYAIQGIGAALVEKLDGEYYNVMGLPVALLEDMLGKHFDTSVFNLRKI